MRKIVTRAIALAAVICGNILFCNLRVACEETKKSESDFDKDAVVTPILSEEEAREERKELLTVCRGKVPDGYIGGILFDGIAVRKLYTDRNGLTTWEAKPIEILLGAEQVHEETVKLVTAPTGKRGGVTFHPGHCYRIFAIDFPGLSGKPSGRWSVWNGTISKIKTQCCKDQNRTSRSNKRGEF